VLSERKSHRTLVHHLDDLLLGVASFHRALKEGSLLVLERLKQGSKGIHFLVHGVVVVPRSNSFGRDVRIFEI